jgi:hypothetical protein
MRVLTVDLASKFSAVNVRDSQRGVLCEFDSSGKSAFEFAVAIAKAAEEFQPDLILIEDVPYGISSQAMVKPVLRLQGVLLLALHRWVSKTLFVNPSTWQKEYPGVARAPKGLSKAQAEASRIEAARVAAAERGYAPPDLVAAYVASLPDGAKVLKKHTNPLVKQMTDYVDAFLMADWAINLGSFEAVASQPSGVQPVFI